MDYKLSWPLSTKEVAEVLGISSSTLLNRIWSGAVEPPPKLAGTKAFLWYAGHADKAAWALKRKPWSDCVAEHEQRKLGERKGGR